MTRWNVVVLVVAGALAVACTEDDDAAGDGGGGEVTETLRVNLQVTGAEHLREAMDELGRRGFVATVWLSSAEVDASCAYVGELADAGHEIAGKYPDEITDQTAVEDQRAELVALREAVLRCTGQELAGFRATRFTSNADTPALLDELSVAYLEQSARAELLTIYTFEPYPAPGHRFAVLPMPVLVAFGEVSSLCDTAAEGLLTPEQLLEYERAAIDHHQRLGAPLVLEWHPSLTYPGGPGGWWDTFLGVLDQLEAKGSAVRSVTARELVAAGAAPGPVVPALQALQASGRDPGCL